MEMCRRMFRTSKKGPSSGRWSGTTTAMQARPLKVLPHANSVCQDSNKVPLMHTHEQWTSARQPACLSPTTQCVLASPLTSVSSTTRWWATLCKPVKSRKRTLRVRLRLLMSAVKNISKRRKASWSCWRKIWIYGLLKLVLSSTELYYIIILIKLMTSINHSLRRSLNLLKGTPLQVSRAFSTSQ